ncbi:pseudouridine synthase [Brachybacterium hainanense]|uniref:RNA pseudouridylate synthase n=1 Tax=Brachybacterium hainanense TaxID=1541174 RepID=A0ABV6RE55_9MICO
MTRRPAGEGPAAPDGRRPGRAARARARRLPPPLPQREGLDPIHVRAPRPGPALEILASRLPALLAPGATDLSLRFARGEIVRADASVLAADTPIHEGEEIWLHRELAPEDVPDIPLPILLQDAHLLVLDKPHDMATMPRGAHILASALVRLRRLTGIETLTPLHRLDRRTAGVLAFGIRPQERAAYQGLFARGEVTKEYRARVHAPPGEMPVVGERFTMRDRLVRERGMLQTRVEPGEPDAFTEVQVLDAADGFLDLALLPRTGRTHQLRVQLSHRGMPILGDDLYPRVRRPGPADPPLALLSRRLAFTDPITGQRRELLSTRRVP